MFTQSSQEHTKKVGQELRQFPPLGHRRRRHRFSLGSHTHTLANTSTESRPKNGSEKCLQVQSTQTLEAQSIQGACHVVDPPSPLPPLKWNGTTMEVSGLYGSSKWSSSSSDSHAAQLLPVPPEKTVQRESFTAVQDRVCVSVRRASTSTTSNLL